MNNKIFNSFRNVMFGIFRYALVVFFPFIIRTLVIAKLGSEYTGLSSLFSSILQMLSLSELGFSDAVTFALYKPIAENDKEKVCAYLTLFKKIYHFIGALILALGIAITPFCKYLIEGTYPTEINIHILFLLYLLNTVISYLFSGYKSTIFIVNQRADIISKIAIVSNCIIYALQIFALCFIGDYYLYVISMIIGTIINNVLICIYARKRYPDFLQKELLKSEEKKCLFKNVKAVFGHQLDAVIINSADNIVISFFLGLNMITIYNNYYYVISAVLNVMIVIANSFVASIGNTIATSSVEENENQFNIFTYCIGVLNVGAAILMVSLFQNFIEIWVGKQMLFPLSTMILLVASFYIRQFRRPIITYKSAIGLWRGDMYKPYLAAACNIIANIVLVKIIGINGVILSTVLSMLLIEIPWETWVVYKMYFKNSAKQYFTIQMKLILKMAIVGVFIYFISNNLWATTWLQMFRKGFLIFFLTVLMIYLSCYREAEYKQAKKYVMNMLNKRRKKDDTSRSDMPF